MDARVEGSTFCARAYLNMRWLVKKYAQIALCAMLIVGSTYTAVSQPVANKIPIKIKDAVGDSVTMYFGVHPLATYCQDPDTLKNFSDPGSLYEAPAPPVPPPPAPFDTRFADPRGYNADCLDLGLQSVNIHHFTDTTQIDTFQIDFQNSGANNGGYPFTFSWPSYLKWYCDSMRMKDIYGVNALNYNMITNSSVTLNPPFANVWIVMYGPHLPPPLVSPPTLNLPADNAVNQALNPTLSWSAQPLASKYLLQVSSDSLFATFVFNDTTHATSQQVNGLTQATKYFWRAQSYDFLGRPGVFSPVFRFLTGLRPPTLILPANNAIGIPTNPTLTWNKVPTATAYHLQVSTDAGFSSTVYDDATLTDSSQQVSGLINCTPYYWRAAASNANGEGQFSAANVFTVTTTTPAVPILSLPANHDTGIAVNPTTFSWSNDLCAESDTLEIAANDSNALFTFTNLAFYGVVNGTSAPVKGLAQNTYYYWRVKANTSSNGSSAYSSVFEFKSGLNPPTTPSLLLPADGNNSVAPPVAFSWSSAPYAANYQLQISTVSNFSSFVYNDATLTDTTQPLAAPPLFHCVQYYWRVKALNASGSSAFTASRMFKVNEAAPGPPTLTHPANDTVGVNDNPTLRWSTAEACSKTIFRLQLSTDINFAPGSFIFNGIVNDSSKHILGPLLGNTDFYWKVRDSNSTGAGAYSGTFHFKTTPLVTPSTPVPVYPANGQGDIASNPTLMWDSSYPHANTYRLQVALDTNFSILFVNDSTITTTSKQIGPLLISTDYYWRVNAKNSAGTSAFSDRSKFTTLFPPDVPTVIYPYNGANEVSITTNFQWSVANRADNYHLLVARDPALTSIVYNDSNLSVNTTQLPYPLFGNRQYCWHVRAKNSSGWGSWSPTACFNTQLTGAADWTIPLAVNETGPQRDTIYFGMDPAATDCIDPSLGEFELPPVSTGQFDARFVGKCIGEGLRLNIRHFQNYTQVDTFFVSFQPGIGSYPIQFSWPSNFIQLICDSMLITDEVGGGVVKERMDLVSSAEVDNASVGEVMIILWGPKPIPVGVKPQLPELPKGFVLSQNYPNPFNPSTTIQFSIERASHVKITIYDVLGREIAELANNAYFPGVYLLNWDGKNVEGVPSPSGVYYVRMVASTFSDASGRSGSFISTRKMLMLK